MYLKPATTYSTEWFRREVVDGKTLSPPDARATPFGRSTKANENGEFCFDDLPSGHYYLAACTRWERPLTMYQTRPSWRWSYAEITVRDGERAQATLSRKGPFE